MARTPSDIENNSGKKPEALDPLSELSDFLYVCNTTNQAHTHTRTTKAIAEFAGRTISKNMKILIKRGQEATLFRREQSSAQSTTAKAAKRYQFARGRNPAVHRSSGPGGSVQECETRLRIKNDNSRTVFLCIMKYPTGSDDSLMTSLYAFPRWYAQRQEAKRTGERGVNKEPI
jgi:hypothetical protein